ncbi:MAG: hypothetical protein K6A23_08505 [Butyrivibrio sp.]|nr:hypothetical protein [Butyrivibrio sp.]
MSKEYTVSNELCDELLMHKSESYYQDRFQLYDCKSNGAFDDKYLMDIMTDYEKQIIETLFKDVLEMQSNEELTAKKVSDFLKSFNVTAKDFGDNGETLKDNYLDFYKIGTITEDNKYAAMGHFIYNIINGHLARGFLDNKISISRNINGEYEYIAPAGIEDKILKAKANIDTANKAAEPQINSFVQFIGNISKGFGFKNWFTRKVDAYEQKKQDWIKTTDVQKDIELITKFEAMKNKIQRKQNKLTNDIANKKLVKQNANNANKEKYRMLLEQTNSTISFMTKLVMSDKAMEDLNKSIQKLEKLSVNFENADDAKKNLEKVKKDYEKAKSKQQTIRSKQNKNLVDFENLEKKIKPESNSKKPENITFQKTSSELSRSSGISM